MAEHPVDKVFYAIPAPRMVEGVWWPSDPITPARICELTSLDHDTVMKALIQLAAQRNVNVCVYFGPHDAPIEVWRHAS